MSNTEMIQFLIVLLLTIIVLGTMFDYLNTFNHEFGHFQKIFKYTKGEELVAIFAKFPFSRVAYIKDYNLLVITGPRIGGFTQTESNYQFALKTEDPEKTIKEISLGGLQQTKIYMIRQMIKTLLLIIAMSLILQLKIQNTVALFIGWAIITGVNFWYVSRIVKKKKKDKSDWNDFMVFEQPMNFLAYEASDENSGRFSDMIKPYIQMTGWPERRNFTYLYFLYLCRINRLKKVVAPK